MSVSAISPRQHDLDFLKTIVGDEQPKISRIDEESEETDSSTDSSSYTSTSTQSSRPTTSHSHRARNTYNREDSDESSSRPSRPKTTLGRNRSQPARDQLKDYSSDGDSIIGEGDKERNSKNHVTLTLPSSPPKAADEGVTLRLKDPNEGATTKPGGKDTGYLGSTADYKPIIKRRPASAAKASKTKVVDPAAYRLQQKYLELKTLIRGARPEGAGGTRLIQAVSRMASKYQNEAYGLIPRESIQYGYSPRSSRVLEQLGIDGPIYSPRRPGSAKAANLLYSSRSDTDQDSYILIDGTGAKVRTRRVILSPRQPAPEPEPELARNLYHMPPSLPPQHHGKNRNGRALVRRPISSKKKAWAGSQTNSEVSSQKSTPKRSSPRSSPSKRSSRSRSRSSNKSRSPSRGRKSKRRSRSRSSSSYSYSFDSDSRSRSRSGSRSRSRSKTKAVDLHLKYTKNEKLLEWLKEKDKLHKEQKRKERKEKKEKRKQNRQKAEEKEKIKEKSEVAVENWMKKKSSEMRLIKRQQKANAKLATKKEDESFVVIDETLDLKDYGAKIDPEKVPKAPHKKASDKNDVPTAPAKKESDNKKDEMEEEQNNEEENNKESSEGQKEPGEKQSTYPRPNSALPPNKKNLKGRKARPQSGLMTHARPGNRPQARFAEGAKDKAKQLKDKVLKEKEEEDKKRKSYNEFLKTNRKTAKEEKNNNAEVKQESGDEKLERQPGVGAEKDEPKEQTKAEGGRKESTEREGSVEAGGDAEVEKKEKSDDDTKNKASSEEDKQAEEGTSADIENQGDANEGDPAKPGDEQPCTTPRPKTPTTKAYKAVKHEQKSWDQFGDYVWKDVNKEAEEEYKKNEEEDERKAFDEEPPSSVNEVDWAKEEKSQKKVMVSGGDNDISPPLWQTEDGSSAKTEEKDQENGGDGPSGVGKEDDQQESPSVGSDPMADVQKSGTFLTATE